MPLTPPTPRTTSRTISSIQLTLALLALLGTSCAEEPQEAQRVCLPPTIASLQPSPTAPKLIEEEYEPGITLCKLAGFSDAIWVVEIIKESFTIKNIDFCDYLPAARATQVRFLDAVYGSPAPTEVVEVVLADAFKSPDYHNGDRFLVHVYFSEVAPLVGPWYGIYEQEGSQCDDIEYVDEMNPKVPRNLLDLKRSIPKERIEGRCFFGMGNKDQKEALHDDVSDDLDCP